MTQVFDLRFSLTYTIFRILNIGEVMDAYEIQGEFLKAIAHPTRLVILEILRDGEQCVCHMEATLKLRQAYISQQLMILKQAGLVEPRRDGLNLYYRVVKPEVFAVLDSLNSATGVTPKLPEHKHKNTECPCPKCNAKAGKTLVQLAEL
jgi:ArsR family transcriptional regulator